MSYKVLVVDDEPMAVRAICRVIEKNCPAFVVSGEAVNGKDALDKIERDIPDVVLTDIQMPVTDGLSMARLAREKHPDLCFVVISGYQDYAYMREAIRNGVLDYLAKPIMPSSITAMMERVRLRLDLLFYERRNELLRRMSRGKQVEGALLRRYFPYRLFYAALVRENGLPRRLTSAEEPELFGTLQEPFCVFGRDSMEQMFLIPEPLLEGQLIVDYMEKTGRRQRQEHSYVTMLYYGTPFAADQIHEKIQGLYHWLNVLSTVGKSQCIDLDHIGKGLNDQTAPNEEKLEEFLHELKGYEQTRQYDRLRQRIAMAYDTWAVQERPQLWLENVTRRLAHFIRQEDPRGNSLLESEYQLEEAFYYATDMTMLRENLENLFYWFGDEQKAKPKVDSPEFFRGVEDYLKRHMAEPLSLESLSGRFCISQAYMSKLFRKYSGQSYNRYLTQLRMEQAKELMQKNPDLFVRDIALLVGYQDQFYFSRIFRSYTGKSPADYLKSE